MAEDEQASKKCFRCQKSKPGEGGVLCRACKIAIETFIVPWEEVLPRAKQVSAQAR